MLPVESRWGEKEKRRRRIKERKLGDELELCPRAVIAGVEENLRAKGQGHLK